ncbi:MAG: rRNA maturation RNase YbeY [Planctomycetes bacterium]|nr:rRNA maturation RNase YbeY [Planctomycetota bacterium]
MSSANPQVRFTASTPVSGLTAKRVQEVVSCVWEFYAGPSGVCVEVVTLPEAEHCAMHAEFLNDPTPTDVMAFPYSDEDLFGEILINVDFALREARVRKKTQLQEIDLYLAHGALHLLGFRDGSPSEKREMRAAEARVLKSLS